MNRLMYLRPHYDPYLGPVHKLTVWNRHPRIAACSYTCLLSRSQAHSILSQVAESQDQSKYNSLEEAHEMTSKIFKPGTRIYLPYLGSIAYIADDGQLLATGEEGDTESIKGLPTMTEDEAYEYEEEHGQHN